MNTTTVFLFTRFLNLSFGELLFVQYLAKWTWLSGGTGTFQMLLDKAKKRFKLRATTSAIIYYDFCEKMLQAKLNLKNTSVSKYFWS